MGAFVKKYQLILFLSFMVIMMAVIKLTYKPSVSTVSQQASFLTPTTLPTLQVSIAPTDSASDSATSWEKVADQTMPLWRLLPYKGEGFTIEAYQNKGVLAVTLNSGTKSEALKAITTWIKQQGVDPTSQKIEWR